MGRTFRKWPKEPREKALEKKRGKLQMWVVTASFFAMRNINDARYLPGEGTRNNESVNKPRDNNLPFLKSCAPLLSKHFSSYPVLSDQTVCSIALGEQLPVYHGKKNEFYGRRCL